MAIQQNFGHFTMTIPQAGIIAIPGQEMKILMLLHYRLFSGVVLTAMMQMEHILVLKPIAGLSLAMAVHVQLMKILLGIRAQIQ